MPVVAAYHYRHGRRVGSVDLDRPVTCPEDNSEFVWVGMVEPEEQELRRMQEVFHLHPLAVEDASVSHQLPKLEVFDDQLFVVVRTARLEGDHISYGETSIFVGRHFLISVRHGSVRTHTTLREHVEASPQRLSMGVDYVLHGILDFIVDGFLPMMDAIEDNVLELEKRTLDTALSRAEVAYIFRLRRELAKFQRSLAPMIEVIAKLVNLDLPCIDPNTKPYFRDVLDHARRVDAMVSGLREVLGQVFEVSALFEQQRQGEITRQLAAWAAILAVPTAIAGIYGMNFDNMPELHWRYGYYVVLGLIGSIAGGLFYRFRRIGWL
jgi:magnesium transporter